ncbi:hypothetical protein [Pyrodictium occultum]|uniref:hypothetical protein n=1 Tax=Pyrodictium occultum TaxID=2309 RepID=UPI0008AA317E|nr:hypothetical protein [Pyrodictium occultum]
MLNELVTALRIASSFLEHSIPTLFIGTFIAELLVVSRVIDKFSIISKPFINLSNLPSECALSFTASFLDPKAGSAMLAGFYRGNRISRRELYVAALINAFPAIVGHWKSLLPVLLATLGGIGLIYFGILVLIGFIQTVIFILVGRIMFKSLRRRNIPRKHMCSVVFSRKTVGEALVRTVKLLIPILKIMVPAILITSLLISFSIFKYLTYTMKYITTLLPLSMQEISVVATAMVNNIAAYTLAANLLDRGLISVRDLLASLLLGSVFANVNYLRWLIPYYTSLYGVRDGLRIMAISMIIRNTIALGFFYLLKTNMFPLPMFMGCCS